MPLTHVNAYDVFPPELVEEIRSIIRVGICGYQFARRKYRQMLDRKLDNTTKVILAKHDSTTNQAVTLRVMSMCMADCGERKFLEISRNYLITG